MQQEIGKECGPFGPCIEHRCRLWRPIILDEIGPDGKISGTREEWDCAVAWPIFLHQTNIKRTKGVEDEVQAFRKGLTETKPDSALGIIALSFSSLAQSVASTVDSKQPSIFTRVVNKAKTRLLRKMD